MAPPLLAFEFDFDARTLALRNAASKGFHQGLDVSERNGRRRRAREDGNERFAVLGVHGLTIAESDSTRNQAGSKAANVRLVEGTGAGEYPRSPDGGSRLRPIRWASCGQQSTHFRLLVANCLGATFQFANLNAKAVILRCLERLGGFQGSGDGFLVRLLTPSVLPRSIAIGSLGFEVGKEASQNNHNAASKDEQIQNQIFRL